MRRFIALAAVLGICVALMLARSLAHASGPSHGSPVHSATTSYGVQPAFTCWSSVTNIHPYPYPPTTTYYAEFSYVASTTVTVPASADYTTPAESPTPPLTFTAGPHAAAYQPSFDPASPPTWHVGTASATANTLSADKCSTGGV